MDFESVLTAILATNNDIRRQGEEALKQTLAQDASSAAQRLCLAMGSPNPQVAVLAAVLFRRKFFEEKHLARVAPNDRQLLRAQVLALVSPDRGLYYLHRLADVLVNFAVSDGWETDLLGFMATWARSSSQVVKEFGLHLFEEAVEFQSLLGVLWTHAGTVMDILREALVDSNLEVALSAAKTIACFLESSESEDAVLVWSATLPAILTVVINSIHAATPLHRIKDTLESLTELTSTYPLLWTQYLGEMTAAVNTISKDKGQNVDLRFSFVLLLLTLVKESPALAQSNLTFLQEAIVLGLTLMEELNHILSEDTWNQENDEDDISRNDMFPLGKDLLCAIAGSVGGPLLLGTMSQLVPRYLKSENWVRQHTGLLAIGLIAEGCKESYRSSMGSLLDLIIPFLSSQHQRLRWAALTSLGLLISEFQTLIQTQHSERTLPCILSCLHPDNLLRVMVQAASCLNLYVFELREYPKAVSAFTPYVSQVLQQASSLLSHGLSLGYCPLLEETLAIIGHIALVLQVGFSPYVPSFVPGLRQLISCPVVTEEQRDIRTNCICCLSTIVESVRDDRSQFPMVTDLFSYFLSIRQQLSPDDSFVSVLDQTTPHFARYLQDQFHPYLPSILPDLLHKATLSFETEITDAESSSIPTIKSGVQMLTFELRGKGVKNLAVNSIALQEKIAACKTIWLLISNLGRGVIDYFLTIVQALSPLLYYRGNGTVRKCALLAITTGLQACRERQDVVTAAVIRILPEIHKAILFFSQKNTAKLKKIIANLNKILEMCDELPKLDVNLLENVSFTLGKEVQNALNRREARENELVKTSQSPLHQSVFASLKSADEIDIKITRIVMEFLHICFKSFKSAFKPLFQRYFQSAYYSVFYKPRPSGREVNSAVCVLVCMAEYVQDLGESNGSSFTIEQLLGCSAHPSVDVRQNAAYGLGVCSQIADPEVYRKYGGSIVEALLSLMQNPESQKEECRMALDCAVGALGKVAVFRQRDLLDTWLHWLPLAGELQEAQNVNGLFLRHLRLYQDSAQVPRILQSLRSLMSSGQCVLSPADQQLLP